MAAHVRKQIRDALSTLCTGLASTGDRVFKSRLHPLAPAELPALRIHVDEEEITIDDIHSPVRLDRTCTVRIECVSRALETLDDELDEMAKEVEHAIAGDADLGGILNGSLTPDGIEIERDGEGDAPIGTLSLRYLAVYHVLNNAVDAAL
jgi:hypothetical protein